MIVTPQDDTDSLRPDADVDDVVFFSFAVTFVHGLREPASPAFEGRFHRTSTPGEIARLGKPLLCASLEAHSIPPPGPKIRWAGLSVSLPGF